MQDQPKRASGQSMVEMALILPFMLLLIFGIIDLGWYIFGYATVYQAVRNGAEKAAEIPPYATKISPLNRNDLCVSTIISATLDGTPQAMFRDLASDQNGNTFAISYPTGNRSLGQPIQLDVVYNIQPLTPLWRFVAFGNSGRMQVRASTQRSIESMGDNPNAANLIACQP
jgi:hypothetical protein